MVISYECGSGLYINLTNACSNNCSFCVRHFKNEIGNSGSLWLEREPTKEEVIADLAARDLTRYDEIVFCGFGEPMMRLYDLIWVAKWIRKNCDLPIRINTNGQADLIHGEEVAPLLKGLIDTVSISLNAPNAEKYNAICHSRFGEEAFYGLLRFASSCKRVLPHVVFSIVSGTMSAEDEAGCEKVAAELDVPLRKRKFSESKDEEQG